MKRIACFAFALMLLSANFAVSESSKTEHDEYLGELQLMSLYYKMIPEEFDADKITNTYFNFMIYMNATALSYFKYGYYAKDTSGGTATDHVREFILSNMNIVSIATDGYTDWLNGKMDDKQYSEVLMMLVNGVIDNK